jgi:hypothetical protein
MDGRSIGNKWYPCHLVRVCVASADHLFYYLIGLVPSEVPPPFDHGYHLMSGKKNMGKASFIFETYKTNTP